VEADRAREKRGRGAEQTGPASADGPEGRRRSVKVRNCFSFLNKIPYFII
jgi:hypothetical protein